VVWSAVDGGHLCFFVALAGGRGEVVQPFDLLGAQLDLVGGRVLLDARDALGAGNRGDVVALCPCWMAPPGATASSSFYLTSRAGGRMTETMSAPS
jgi:hypothetical protein